MSNDQIPLRAIAIFACVSVKIAVEYGSNKESIKMSTQTITYESILEMIQGIAQRQKETDRQMKETDRKISALGSRIGEIVENMVGGNIIAQFQHYGYNVKEISRNIEFGIKGTTAAGEIDVLLGDGDVAILIEVKTKLTTDDVRHHIEQMEKYRKYKDDNGTGKKRYVGAVAATVVDDNVAKFAHKNGMFVIVQSGYAVEILAPPAGFKVKEW